LDIHVIATTTHKNCGKNLSTATKRQPFVPYNHGVWYDICYPATISIIFFLFFLYLDEVREDIIEQEIEEQMTIVKLSFYQQIPQKWIN
jgi:hypothetical protein